MTLTLTVLLGSHQLPGNKHNKQVSRQVETVFHVRMLTLKFPNSLGESFTYSCKVLFQRKKERRFSEMARFAESSTRMPRNGSNERRALIVSVRVLV